MSRTAAAILFFTALACAYTWPLPLHMATAVPHDTGDPLLVTWLFWWSTHVMPLTERWWNAPAFYPATGVFAFSENLLGLAPLTAPLLWLGRPPLLAYNVAFLASFVLSGLAAYLLGFQLTRQRGPALVAGVAFAFNPYRLSHINHLQLLSSYWMPVSLAMLHRYATDGRMRWAVIFAVAWLMQALACGYYFFFLSVLVMLWLAWFARRWTARRLIVVAACWLCATLMIAPLLAGYKRIQDTYGFKRVPSEIEHYSADVAGIAAAPVESLFWRRLRATDEPESELFPGVTLLLLGLAGAAAIVRGPREVRGPLVFYSGAAFVMWLLALGPSPAFRGHPIGVPGLYSPLMSVPGFNGMRVPARLWMVSLLCLSVTSALVISRVSAPAARRTIVVCAVTGLLLDAWPRSLPLHADPGMPLTHSHAIARLGLPLVGNEAETMYGSIAQERPVVNGYSGYVAPQFRALSDLLERRDPRILRRLAADGPIEVVVRHDLDGDGSWRRFVAGYPGVRITDSTAGWTAFELPQSGDHAPVVAPRGTSLGISKVTASVNEKDVNAVIDGDLDTRWHVNGQEGDETIVADLGGIVNPTALVMSLGTYSGHYSHELELAVSTDGDAWAVEWRGDTGLMTYDAAVRSPRKVPLTFQLDGRPARFIRLRQLASDPGRGWTIVELQVLQ